MKIEIGPTVLSMLILGWALYYYFSTVSKPDGGAQSVLFVKPLVIGMIICFVLVIMGAVKVSPPSKAIEKPVRESVPTDRGLLDHRRLFFVSSLACYAVGLTLFGYLIPSILFILIVCRYLGVRRLGVIIGVSVILSSLMSVIFKNVLGVPVPLWPF